MNFNWLQCGIDNDNRTFPKPIESFPSVDLPIKTKYRLNIIPTGKILVTNLDELHFTSPVSFSTSDEMISKSAEIAKYNNPKKRSILYASLQRIRSEYRCKFEHIVKLMLDYKYQEASWKTMLTQFIRGYSGAKSLIVLQS